MTDVAHFTAALLIGLAMLGHAAALGQLRGKIRPRWWLGYAEDGLHLGMAVVQTALYLALGWPGEAALLAGCMTTLAGYFVDQARRQLGVPWPVWIGLGCAWTLAVGLAAPTLLRAAGAAILWAAPRT